MGVSFPNFYALQHRMILFAIQLFCGKFNLIMELAIEHDCKPCEVQTISYVLGMHTFVYDCAFLLCIFNIIKYR